MQLGWRSDMDGEDAHKAVKDKVEETFAKYNNVPAFVPTISSQS